MYFALNYTFKVFFKNTDSLVTLNAFVSSPYKQMYTLHRTRTGKGTFRQCCTYNFHQRKQLFRQYYNLFSNYWLL